MNTPNFIIYVYTHTIKGYAASFRVAVFVLRSHQLRVVRSVGRAENKLRGVRQLRLAKVSRPETLQRLLFATRQPSEEVVALRTVSMCSLSGSLTLRSTRHSRPPCWVAEHPTAIRLCIHCRALEPLLPPRAAAASAPQLSPHCTSCSSRPLPRVFPPFFIEFFQGLRWWKNDPLRLNHRVIC